MDEVTFNFLNKLLTLNPEKRISAKHALRDPYFTSEPLPCSPDNLPRIEGEAHELTVKEERYFMNN